MSSVRDFLKRNAPLPALDLLRRLETGMQSRGFRSYAMEGEDRLLAALFRRERVGFYVDVGAHHPRRYSNTHGLYRRRWRGINIDPAPGSMRAFRRARPRDTNLELAVSDRPGEVLMTLYSDPAISRFSEYRQEHDVDQRWIRKLGEVSVQARTLADILEQYLPPDQAIDLLNVDVERHDLNVLRSNDWHRFRPRAILIETFRQGVEAVCRGEIHGFLSEREYEFYAKTINTSLFVARESGLISSLEKQG